MENGNNFRNGIVLLMDRSNHHGTGLVHGGCNPFKKSANDFLLGISHLMFVGKKGGGAGKNVIGKYVRGKNDRGTNVRGTKKISEEKVSDEINSEVKF